MGDLHSIPGLGKSLGEGNGYPLQYSCLENSMDRGAWWPIVHRVTKSQTWLRDLTLTWFSHLTYKYFSSFLYNINTSYFYFTIIIFILPGCSNIIFVECLGHKDIVFTFSGLKTMLKRTSSAYFSSLHYSPRINSLAQEEKIWAFLIYIVILICKKITTKQPKKNPKRFTIFMYFLHRDESRVLRRGW